MTFEKHAHQKRDLDASRLPAMFLAPVFGYTNSAFRLLCQRHCAGATVVPLVSASALAHGIDVIDAVDQERNLGVQLSGTKPTEFAKAVAFVERKFSFVKRFDLNAGCPSSNTMQNGGGAALMREPEILTDIVKAMKEKTDLPVSVKMRIFSDRKRTIALASEIEASGADFITVHGRTAKQGYGGAADWEAIRAVKESLSIPVVGNGNVNHLKDGISRIKEGYCDSFMVGRAAMSNPLVFEDRIASDYGQKKKLFLEYVGICRTLGTIELNDLKQKSAQFFRGIEHGATIRNRFMQCGTVDELLPEVG